MNRSKLFIGIFIAFILIVITIVLLACTVFIVREVTVESDVSSNLLDEESIVESSGLTIGRSIISISKEKVKNSIEKDNPYVEVLNIVRIFPNKVIVKVTVRTGVMVIESSTHENVALIDTSMKVLKVVTAAEASSFDATIVKGVTFDIPEGGVDSLIGSRLTLNNAAYDAIFSEIAEFTANYDLQGQSFSTLFKEITFTEKDTGTVVLIRTNKNVTFVLDKSLASEIYYQMYKCMFLYVKSDYSTGYIGFDRTNNAYAWMESLD